MMAGEARCVQKDRKMMRNDKSAQKHALGPHGMHQEMRGWKHD
jgi:hypothetical protein